MNYCKSIDRWKPVEREYELFEQLPDGSPMWRGQASGLHGVRLKLQEIARTTTNECFAMYLPTKEIVARLNLGAGKPLVVQIAYDNRLATARTEVLRLHGYEVVSVIGNEAAKAVLGLPQHCDLFIVGHAAPEESRTEMVAWLKMKYPGVRIIALNSPKIRELVGADYNVTLNGPEVWLKIVSGALREPQKSGLPPNH
jgi:hypothetical protein